MDAPPRRSPPQFVVAVACHVLERVRSPADSRPGRWSPFSRWARFALGALGSRGRSYTGGWPSAIVFAVVLVASSALMIALQPDGPGLAGLLAGLVLLAPQVPDRFPVALSIVGVTCLAAVAVAVSHGSPALALLSAIAIVKAARS